MLLAEWFFKWCKKWWRCRDSN